MSQLPTYPKSRARAGRPKSARGQRWSNVAEQGLRWLRAEFDSLTVPMPAWDAGRLRATAPTEAAGRRSVVADNALTAAALGGGATGLFLLSRVALRPLPSRLDVAATRLLQRRQSRAVTRVMTVISMPGFAPLQHILTVCTSLDLWALGHRRESLFTMLTMGAGATTGVIKVAVGRPRPDPVYMRAIFQFRDNSFPSGHCSHYASFYGYLFYLAHRTMPPALLRRADRLGRAIARLSRPPLVERRDRRRDRRPDLPLCPDQSVRTAAGRPPDADHAIRRLWKRPG